MEELVKKVVGNINHMYHDEETDLICQYDYKDDFKLINEIKRNLLKAIS